MGVFWITDTKSARTVYILYITYSMLFYPDKIWIRQQIGLPLLECRIVAGNHMQFHILQIILFGAVLKST